MTGSGAQREVVRADGATIAYDIVGDGPPVIFLHGLTSRRQGWDPVTSLLAPAFTCIRIDLRGHGESSMALDYGLLSIVADVRAVVCAGNSRLRFGDFTVLVQARAQALRGEGAMRAVLEIDRELDLGLYKDDEEFERRVLAFPPEVVRGIWAQALATPPEELTAVSEALLPAIEAPLLSLHGSRPPEDYPLWLTGVVPTAEVEVWDGMGHLLHLVDPPRFAERVHAFLA